MDTDKLSVAVEPERSVRPLPLYVSMILAEHAKKMSSAGAIADDVAALVSGVRLYQENPYSRTVEPLRDVWRCREVRLFLCPAEGQCRGSLFLVPSMVNRSTIFDLLSGQSFVRWMSGRGLDVFLLDWGESVYDIEAQTLDDVIIRRLLPALEFAIEMNRTKGPLTAGGYCMGGTMLAAALSLRPDLADRALFMATPWDFQTEDDVVSAHVRTGAVAALQMIEGEGKLPARWMQTLFSVVDTEKTMRKFADFATLAPGGTLARIFVAVEDWLNEGVDLPGSIARTCIQDWYGRNDPAHGRWQVGGRPVTPVLFDKPTLVMTGRRDGVVPTRSSAALAKILSHCQTFAPDYGHIGLLTGQKAPGSVWAPVADWMLREQS